MLKAGIHISLVEESRARGAKEEKANDVQIEFLHRTNRKLDYIAQVSILFFRCQNNFREFIDYFPQNLHNYEELFKIEWTLSIEMEYLH